MDFHNNMSLSSGRFTQCISDARDHGNNCSSNVTLYSQQPTKIKQMIKAAKACDLKQLEELDNVDFTLLPDIDKNKLLFQAALQGNDKLTKIMINAGADFTRNIIEAVKNGNIKSVRTLLANGADPNTKDDNGTPILNLAVFYGVFEIIKELIGRGADVTSINTLGETSWNIVIENGKSCVEKFIKAGADVTKPDKNGDIPLFLAMRRNETGSVEEILKAGSPLEILEKSAIIEAATQGNTQCVYSLIDYGADIEKRNKYSSTVLMIAAQAGHSKIVETLLSSGAEVNATDKLDSSALLYACETPWPHASIHMDRYECVNLLINAKADVNQRTRYGYTALSYAAEISSHRSMSALIDAGADVNSAADSTGITALMSAAIAGCSRIQKYIPDKTNNISEEAIRSVRILLKAKTHVDMRDTCGNNALKCHLVECLPWNKTLLMLLFAAGETLDVSYVEAHDHPGYQAAVPKYLQQDRYWSLMSLSRDAIRDHLLELNPLNLFHKVPFLGLPTLLCKYLLYNMTLDDEEESDDDDDDEYDDDNLNEQFTNMSTT